MYPVVLYLLRFSRKVRKRLAVNVSFIPVIKSVSSNGRRLSKALVKQARSIAIQGTLKILLDSLDPNLKIGCHPSQWTG